MKGPPAVETLKSTQPKERKLYRPTNIICSNMYTYTSKCWLLQQSVHCIAPVYWLAVDTERAWKQNQGKTHETCGGGDATIFILVWIAQALVKHSALYWYAISLHRSYPRVEVASSILVADSAPLSLFSSLFPKRILMGFHTVTWRFVFFWGGGVRKGMSKRSRNLVIVNRKSKLK